MYACKHYATVLIHPGADPGFFLGGGALVSCSTSTPINHIVFFSQNTSCIRKPQVISGGRGVRTPCTLPLDPPLPPEQKLISNSHQPYLLTVGHAVGAAGIFASWDKNKDKEITKEEVYILILRFFLKILKTVTEFLFLADQGLVFLDPSCVHIWIASYRSC